MTENVSGNYGYKCFYGGREWDCHAPSLYAAKQLALSHFGAKPGSKKANMISVVLCERPDGSTVSHSTASF